MPLTNVDKWVPVLSAFNGTYSSISYTKLVPLLVVKLEKPVLFLFQIYNNVSVCTTAYKKSLDITLNPLF